MNTWAWQTDLESAVWSHTCARCHQKRRDKLLNVSQTHFSRSEPVWPRSRRPPFQLHWSVDWFRVLALPFFLPTLPPWDKRVPTLDSGLFRVMVPYYPTIRGCGMPASMLESGHWILNSLVWVVESALNQLFGMVDCSGVLARSFQRANHAIICTIVWTSRKLI